MNIVHVVPTGNWAGTESIACGLAAYQARQHAVTVVLRASAAFPPEFLRAKVPKAVRLSFLPSDLRRGEQEAEWVRGQLGDRGVDIVHAHLGPGCAVANWLGDWCTARLASMHIRFFMAHFKQMDAVVAISPWQLGDIPRSFAGRAYCVNNFLGPLPDPTPARLDTFRRSLYLGSKTYVIGSIGRLHLEKGFDVLCRAFMQADMPDARLVIIGDGPERARLSRLVQRDPRIVLKGFMNEACQYMPAFDLYVSASRGEAFGLTLLEAMHYRRPIVATATFGARDVMAPHPECLVGIEDEGGLRAAMEAHYRSRGAAPAYDLSPYAEQRCNEAMLEVYRDLLSHRRLTPHRPAAPA